MKHVALDEAKIQLDRLVAEVEFTGDDVVLTRGGVAVVRLVRETVSAPSELTPAQIERRREVIARVRQRAAEFGPGPSHEEIKQWVNEGRR